MGWPYALAEIAAAIGGTLDGGAGSRATGVSTDSRSLAAGQLFVALRGERFDGEDFVAEALARGAAGAICRRPHPEGACIVVPDTLAALQQLAAWHRASCKVPVIGITGSCGKTSTKDFVAALLATRFEVIKTLGNLNNEIGCPLSLLRITEHIGAAVIEMGANHVGEIAQLCRLAQPTESAITMVGPAHLEGFGSIERVAQAKGEIAEGLCPGGLFYVNNDDPWCRWVGERYAGPKCYFGRSGDVVLERQQFDEAGDMLLDIAPVGRLRLPLPIPAQAQNVLLAVAIGLQHGVSEFEGPLRLMCRQSTRFRLVPVGGITVLDDTYNANPASMTAALEALAARKGGRKLAALGSMLELGERSEEFHRVMGETAARLGVAAVFAYGPEAHAMIAGARAAGAPFAEAFDTHEALTEAVCAQAQPGDILLLKGSRGMRMERVLSLLEARPSPARPRVGPGGRE